MAARMLPIQTDPLIAEQHGGDLSRGAARQPSIQCLKGEQKTPAAGMCLEMPIQPLRGGELGERTELWQLPREALVAFNHVGEQAHRSAEARTRNAELQPAVILEEKNVASGDIGHQDPRRPQFR